jgi:hypothetical protein
MPPPAVDEKKLVFPRYEIFEYLDYVLPFIGKLNSSMYDLPHHRPWSVEQSFNEGSISIPS